MHNGKVEKIRLAGIDCPERGQPYGKAAKRFVISLAAQKRVTVKVLNKDRYGRTVGEVILPDGKTLNRELLKAGLAWWYRKYAPKNRLLEILELTARMTKKGLWAEPNPVAPWDFRRRR